VDDCSLSPPLDGHSGTRAVDDGSGKNCTRQDRPTAQFRVGGVLGSVPGPVQLYGSRIGSRVVVRDRRHALVIARRTPRAALSVCLAAVSL